MFEYSAHFFRLIQVLQEDAVGCIRSGTYTDIALFADRQFMPVLISNNNIIQEGRLAHRAELNLGTRHISNHTGTFCLPVAITDQYTRAFFPGLNYFGV
ncbi:hypothetical protein D3C87_1888550 [compost metagenome]